MKYRWIIQYFHKNHNINSYQNPHPPSWDVLNCSYGHHVYASDCIQSYTTTLFSDKPRTPTIVLNKHPFVCDQMEFTCTSQEQRWPVGLSSSFTYKFSVDGAQHNTLKINITDSDKGQKVFCNAMDDRRDVSNVNNIITLDLYCEYN